MEPNRPNEETNKTHPNNAPPETSTVSVSGDKTRAETNYHHAPPPHRVSVRPPFSPAAPHRPSVPEAKKLPSPPPPQRLKPKRTGVTGPQHGRHPSTGVPRPTNHTRPSPGRTRARGRGLGPLTAAAALRRERLGGNVCTCTFEREGKKGNSTQPSPDRKTSTISNPPCLPLPACQS